jgi:hypothetical protein
VDERAYVRAGALALVVGGIVAAVGNLLHPRYPNMEDVQVYGKVAHSGAWRPADALVLVAIVLTIAGMTALAVALQASQWGVLASYGRVAALVGGAVAVAAPTLDKYAKNEAAQ